MSLWHPFPLKHQHELTIFLTFTKYSVTFSFGEAYKISSSFCANHSLCIALFASMKTSMSPTSSTHVTLAPSLSKHWTKWLTLTRAKLKLLRAMESSPNYDPAVPHCWESVMEDKFCSIFKSTVSWALGGRFFMAVKCTRFTPVQWGRKKNSVSVCRKGQ